MRRLSRDEIDQIAKKVYNEGYRGYVYDEELTSRVLKAMDESPREEQK